jgi:integrase
LKTPETISLIARIPKIVGGKKVWIQEVVDTEKNGKPTAPKMPPNATRFYLRFKEGERRRLVPVGTNFSVAVTALSNKQMEREYTKRGLDVPGSVIDPTGRLTVASAVAKFIRQSAAKGRTQTTQDHYKRVAEEFQTWCGSRGVIYLDVITRDTILDFMAWCRENVTRRGCGCRNGMIITRLQYLSSMWTTANGRKLTFPLPWSEWPKAEKTTVKTFTDEELNLILSKAEVDEADLFLFSMSTGMRASELGHVFYSDVNHKTRVVTITNKPSLNWRTKDGNPRETGTLSADVLARIMARRKRHKAPQESPIFTNGKGGPLSGTRVTEVFRRMAKRAGFENAFPAGQGNHKLRKTYGTRIAKMKSPTTAQKLLGHDNLATTMRYLEAETVKQGEADDLYAGVGK